MSEKPIKTMGDWHYLMGDLDNEDNIINFNKSRCQT